MDRRNGVRDTVASSVRQHQAHENKQDFHPGGAAKKFLRLEAVAPCEHDEFGAQARL
ncbi:hypothetical protein ACFOHK_16965 [Falsigemmobacter intermedius]|uniref:hypothetical protein n=1 Tax=Falsigemmobacter intermedius TaxID=1553448 RepID=UPI00361B2DEC